MAVPDFQTLMLPVLRETANGPVAAPELRRRVAEVSKLTEEELAELLPSGRQTKFANRVAWSNVHLQRAGLIGVVRRGVYEATPAGKELLASAPELAYRQKWRSKSATCPLARRSVTVCLSSSDRLDATVCRIGPWYRCRILADEEVERGLPAELG
jgi:restriction endonuclease Mrr